MGMSWSEYEDKYGESREELLRSDADTEERTDIKEFYKSIELLKESLVLTIERLDEDYSQEKIKSLVSDLEDITSELADLAETDYFDPEYADGYSSEEERIFGAEGFHGWANPGMSEKHNREQRNRWNR